MRYFECFTSSIAIQKSKPLFEADNKTILAFRRSNLFSLGNPIVMQADPFLFAHGDTLYVFFEGMRLIGGHGAIIMTSTKDLKTFTKPIKITNEPDCHFSYPFVFEDNGQVYMMPETGCDFNIRLYKATSQDLTKFELHKVILERSEKDKKKVSFDFADSCIYKKGSKYYLFTSYYADNTYFLELYLSDELDGPYEKHPQSPICSGNKYGRCGGPLIEADGHLYRPAQDCVATYGGQVHLMEIDELTPTLYKEHTYRDDVLPKNQKRYKIGGHQLSFAKFKGKTVVATDEKYYCTFLLARLLDKAKRLLNPKLSNNL